MNIKNLIINKNISKKTLALMTICSLTLLNGCTKEDKEELSKLFVNTINKPKGCEHLTILFQDETITFKECDGYSISSYYNENHDLNYSIYLDGTIITDGTTTFYNKYNVYHEDIEKLENDKILIK